MGLHSIGISYLPIEDEGKSRFMCSKKHTDIIQRYFNKRSLADQVKKEIKPQIWWGTKSAKIDLN
jgi:hypothetical protein